MSFFSQISSRFLIVISNQISIFITLVFLAAKLDNFLFGQITIGMVIVQLETANTK